MNHKPDNNDAPQTGDQDIGSQDAVNQDSGIKGVRRKLRYDAPALNVPRPLYLRANDDDQSDEEAA